MNTRGMTPLQHYAMCLAAGGYWQLADAMELIHHNSEDSDVIAIHHAPSHTTMLGLCEGTTGNTRCLECDGACEMECDLGHWHDCTACDGTGTFGPAQPDNLQWISLDGNTDEDFKPTGRFITTLDEARPLVRDYTRLIERLQVAA